MIKGVSLFSNVGIAETYLKECGIDIVVSNEILQERADFYKNIYPDCKMIRGDITEDKVFNEIILNSIKKECKFLIATPPCQGMSVAGKRDYTDSRNSLIIKVIEAIDKINPDYVIIENVVQALKTKIEYNNYYETIENIMEIKFKDKYFINKNKIIDAQDYGIPQRRKRAIILMSKINICEFPEKEMRKTTVEDAIGHLPSVEAIVREKEHRLEGNEEKIKICKKIHKWHIPRIHPWRHVEAMMNTPTGRSAFENEIYYPKKIDGTKVKGYNTTYKRMKWDEPAPTITMANGAISSQCNVHPGRKNSDGTYSDARALTIYELMLLSTLPQDWNIPEWASDTLIREVIGEGIPPLLMKKIVKNMIKNNR